MSSWDGVETRPASKGAVLNPEELDKARAEEAFRRASHPIGGRCPENTFEIYRELVVSNWTPPDPISPRVLAAREWLKESSDLRQFDHEVDMGRYDHDSDAKAFLAGFAAAVKLAEPLVEAAEAECHRINLPFLGSALTTYRQSIGDGE